MYNPLLYSLLGFSVSTTLLWCFTRQCIWEGCVGVELWSTLCFDSSKECVAAGKAEISPSLLLLFSSHIQEAWAGSSTVQSLQVQFSPCIKPVLGRHFYKFLADFKSRSELGFKKPWKCKPVKQEDFSVVWSWRVFWLIPYQKELFLLFFSCQIFAGAIVLKDLFFIVKLTSSQVYSDQVVIETNGLAPPVMGGCQTVCSDVLAINSWRKKISRSRNLMQIFVHPVESRYMFKANWFQLLK